MNKTRLIAAAIAALTLSAPAAAADVNAAFNVRVTLTSACKINTDGTNIDLTYTGFQAGDATNSGTVSFDCTRGFSPTSIRFDTGTDKTSSAAGATATGAGVVGGLRYTLAAAVDSTNPGTAATTSLDGSGDEVIYKIDVEIPGGQAGTDAATQQSQARTLILTY